MKRCTRYEVNSSSGDVVIYWTMTGTHVVPDRQQYDGHTPITCCPRALIQLLLHVLKHTTAVWNLIHHYQFLKISQ